LLLIIDDSGVSGKQVFQDIASRSLQRCARGFICRQQQLFWSASTASFRYMHLLLRNGARPWHGMGGEGNTMLHLILKSSGRLVSNNWIVKRAEEKQGHRCLNGDNNTKKGTKGKNSTSNNTSNTSNTNSTGTRKGSNHIQPNRSRNNTVTFRNVHDCCLLVATQYPSLLLSPDHHGRVPLHCAAMLGECDNDCGNQHHNTTFTQTLFTTATTNEQYHHATTHNQNNRNNRNNRNTTTTNSLVPVGKIETLDPKQPLWDPPSLPPLCNLWLILPFALPVRQGK
jgi:hypothetical protein